MFKSIIFVSLSAVLAISVNRAISYQAAATAPIADEVICDTIEECTAVYFQ